jgi:hypothetical protein
LLLDRQKRVEEQARLAPDIRECAGHGSDNLSTCGAAGGCEEATSASLVCLSRRSFVQRVWRVGCRVERYVHLASAIPFVVVHRYARLVDRNLLI